MPNMDNRNNLSEGTITYSDSVVATIAGIAAAEVEHVTGMSGNLVSGVTEMFGKKDFGKGVKVEIKENDLKLDLSIIVKYGVQIQNVCREVQENVRKAIENMTDLNIVAINVCVQGIFVDNKASK
jgi:uncharacterized alkaline shock family protein YloU